MAAQSPLVTVLLPARNAAAYLPQALQSLWTQTLDDIEVVVVDDGSDDGTTELLSREKDDRLVVVGGSGAGIAAALNAGLAEARGTFIARMDADDVSVPDRLQRQLGFLDLHPDIGVVGSNIAFLRGDGRATARRTRLPITPEGVCLHLHIGNCLPHPTAVLRRELLERVGGYRVDRPAAEDYDLWLRLLPLTRLANLDACLVRYRQHAANASALSQRAGADSVAGQVAELLQDLLHEVVDVDAVRRLLLPNEGVHDDADVASATGALHAVGRVLAMARSRSTLSAADLAAVRRRHDYVAARLVMVMLKRRRLEVGALLGPAVRSALGGAARGGAHRIADSLHDVLPVARRGRSGVGTEGNPPL